MMTMTRMKNELENYLNPRVSLMREDLLKEAKNLVARYSAIREYEDDVSVLRDSDYELKVALENLQTAIHNIKQKGTHDDESAANGLREEDERIRGVCTPHRTRL